MRPDPAPVLKGKTAKEFAKVVEKRIEPEDIKIFEEADRVFKAIKNKK